MRSSSVHSERCSIAGLVLASGMSRRFGLRNKLLVPVEGAPVVVRTVRAYVDAALEPVLVVVGYQAEEILSALSGLSIIPVFNPDFELGQSRALVHGVHAVPSEAGAAVIGVADQPFLRGEVISNMVAAYRSTGAPLVVPRYVGRRGNPVLFDRSLFGKLLQVSGDRGGRPVLEHHHEEILWVDVADARIGGDIDTVEDYKAIAADATQDQQGGA